MWILKAVLRNMLPVTPADKDEPISTSNPHKKKFIASKFVTTRRNSFEVLRTMSLHHACRARWRALVGLPEKVVAGMCWRRA